MRFKANGSLSHIIALGDGEVQSPLLKPGTSWILKADDLTVGEHKVHCEVTCIRCIVVVEPPATPRGGEDAPVDLAEEAEDEDDEDEVYDDPRIDGLLAQMRAGNAKAQCISKVMEDDDDAEEAEDEAEFMRERQRRGIGGTALS